jgi:CubicO group peptidase (beta-lactamase class C family)
MKKLLTTTCLFVVTTIATVSFIAPTVFGQEKIVAKASPTPAESVTARVDKLFAQWDKPDSTGCALGIIKDGKLIYTHGYGMANLDYNIPISSRSVFEIGSMVKQFIGMSILLLERQGKLSLDDDIQKYLPEIPRYQSPITIRHLIHHTSGIRSHYALAVFAGLASFDLTDDDVLGLIARQKELNFKPGEEFNYTDTAYFLLGLIVKKVSGKSVHEFADENIFKPLGMTNTILEVDRTLVVRNQTTRYTPGSNGGFSVPITHPHGEMDTTVEDLFLWDQNFYNNKLGGGPDLIREEVSSGMFNNGEKINYAFGLGVNEYKGLKRIGHGGQQTGSSSFMNRFPEQNFSVICLCNADIINTHGLADQVADIFLADQFKQGAGGVNETVPAIISIPEKELASLAGLYFDPITEISLYRFYMKDGNLMIDPNFNKGPAYVLSPVRQNRFKVVGPVGAPEAEIVFVRPIAGGSMQVKINVAGRKPRTLDAVQNVPSSIQLAEFTGKYVSDELGGATYTLSIKDGKLIMQVRRGITVFSDKGQVLAVTQAYSSEAPKDIPLTPVFADAFEFGIEGRIIVRFTRNQQNAVSGFTLTNSVVRRLRFNKL